MVFSFPQPNQLLLNLATKVISAALLNTLIGIAFRPCDIVVRSRAQVHDVTIRKVFILHRIQVIIQLMPVRKNPLHGQGVDDVKHPFYVGLKIHQTDPAAFLYHAIAAGLDMGIVNAGQLAVYEENPQDLRALIVS